MAKARRSIDVEVPPERFFEVVRDYARYPEFLPEVKAVSVGPRTGDSVEVTYRLDARIKLIEFTLLHVESAPSRIEWRLVRGDLMKRDAGPWRRRRPAARSRRTRSSWSSCPGCRAGWRRRSPSKGFRPCWRISRRAPKRCTGVGPRRTECACHEVNAAGTRIVTGMWGRVAAGPRGS